MTTLEDIISRGVARYEASLPDRARTPIEIFDAALNRINVTLSEERQTQLCLSCSLSDCVGIESRQCPIQIEQRAEWRRLNHRESKR
jgi:hypothetical protein